ncbi:pol: RNA-directed DNA polymerase from mobile element jockey, partial [Crotalus adamanteus]
KRIKHSCHPKYLRIILDQSLIFGKHLEVIGQKLKTRKKLIRRIAGTRLGSTNKNFVYSGILISILCC